MKKNGFTLIELLAVIVILAIIALIATPIILGIINDAREKANERSVELYASAVRNAVAAYQLIGTSAPKSFEDLDIQYDGDVVCSVQELYSDGSFYLEGCKVNKGIKEYSYGIKEVAKGTIGICNPAEEQYFATEPLEEGYKYECDVDPNKEGYDYTFYVLNSDGTSVNLIMDRNICEDGTPTEEGKTCPTAYNEDGDARDVGPVTAMTYLNKATSTWQNIDNLNLTYDDEGGIFEDFVINGKARMPYFNEISYHNNNNNNGYLYDNLNLACLDDEGNDISCSETENILGVNVEGITHISGIGGYWTFSTHYGDYEFAWYVEEIGSMNVSDVDSADFVSLSGYDNFIGVRPVINLSI